VEKKPEAKSYYDLKEASIKFTLPEPGFLEGVKSKDRAILKMHSVGYTYAVSVAHSRIMFGADC
jgi:elongation factor 3